MSELNLSRMLTDLFNVHCPLFIVLKQPYPFPAKSGLFVSRAILLCLHAPTAQRQLNFARESAYARTLPGHVTTCTHVRTGGGGIHTTLHHILGATPKNHEKVVPVPHTPLPAEKMWCTVV